MACKSTCLRVLTWNLWGRAAPGPYLRDRGVLRGAIGGSDATAAFDGAYAWTHRRPLLLNAMRSAQADTISVQECLGSGESNSHQLGAELGVSVYQDAESPGLAILSQVRVITSPRAGLMAIIRTHHGPRRDLNASPSDEPIGTFLAAGYSDPFTIARPHDAESRPGLQTRLRTRPHIRFRRSRGYLGQRPRTRRRCQWLPSIRPCRRFG